MIPIDSIRSIHWITGPRGPILPRIAHGTAPRGQQELSMLGIGQKFPGFALTGVVSNDLANAFQPFDNQTAAGKWQVIFFWPKDFTFVCPTEIAAFGKLDRAFR